MTEEGVSDTTLYKLSPLSEREKEIMKNICGGGVKIVHINLKDGTEFITEIQRKKPAKLIVEQIEVFIARKKYNWISLEGENEKKIYINQSKK